MLSNLPDDVKFELEDKRYGDRTHGTRATYAEGCHGPLCRKAERDRGRKRHESRQMAAGKIVTPRPPGDAQARDSLLDRITEAHRRERGLSGSTAC